MTFQFYAYWNGAQIRDLLEAMIMIVGTGDFFGLLKSVALAGFLSVITVAALRYKGLEVMSFFVAVLLFYTVTIVPKTTVIVRDDRAAQVYPVDHVPLGLAFLASTTSHVGHWLTEQFETAFASADAERFSRFGMVFPQRAVSALLAAGPVTPQGRLLISGFNRHCVVPELVDYPNKLNALVASGNLWGTISTNGWVNPARHTPDVDGRWITCDVAVTAIENYLNQQEVPAIEERLAMKLVPDHVNPSAVIASALPQSETVLLGLSQTLSSSIKHSVFMNTLDDDLSQVAALSKNPLAVATKLAKAQGNLASELNYRTMSQIAQDALPKVRNALQFVILAAFPLILIMVVATGHMAASILRNYLTLLIWIELWAPISSVINYLMIHVDAHPMNQIIQQYGANSIMAATLIRETGASSQAIAGYLMILAPVIAFAIAKGSDIASAQMVGSMMAPAQSAAQSQGSTLAQGNITLGNSSWGNVSTNNINGNKSDLSTSFIDSSMMRTASAYGSITRNGDGTVTGMSATEISTGVNSTMGLGESNSLGKNSATTNTMSYNDAVNGLRQFMTQTTDKSMAGFTNQLNTEISRSHGLSERSSESESIGQSLSVGKSTSLSEQMNNSQGLSIETQTALNASEEKNSDYLEKLLGLSTKKASSVAELSATDSSKLNTSAKNNSADNSENQSDWSGSISASINTAQDLTDTITQQSNTTNQTQKQNAYQTLLSATRQIAATTKDTGIRQAAETFESQLTAAYQYSMSSSFNQTASTSAGEQMAQVSQQDIRTLMNANPEAMLKAIDTFGSPERAQSALFHSAAARSAFAQSLQNEQLQTPYRPKTALPLSLKQIDQISKAGQQATLSDFEQQFEQSTIDNNTTAMGVQAKTIHQAVGSEPDTHAIKNISDQKRETFATNASREENELLLQRGNTRSAAALYSEKERGLSTVIGNAFLGGFPYSSPQNYEEKLDRTARNSSSDERALLELGRQDKTVRINDFERAIQSSRELETSTTSHK